MCRNYRWQTPYLSHIIYDNLSFRITHGDFSSWVGPSHTIKSRVALHRNASSWYLSNLKCNIVKSFISFWTCKMRILLQSVFLRRDETREFSHLSLCSETYYDDITVKPFRRVRKIWSTYLRIFFKDLSIYLSIYLSILCMWVHCSCPQIPQKRALVPITDGCEPPCGCWELNLGLLEEHSECS